MLSMQQIFDKSYKGLMKQGCRGFDAIPRYYSVDGRRCAIGMLLSKVNAAKLEDMVVLPNNDIASLPEKAWELLEANGIDKSHLEFLADLQAAHDEAMDMKEVKRELKVVAKQYGLKVPK